MRRNNKISWFPATGMLLGTLLFSGCGKPPAGPPPSITPEVAVVTVTPAPVTLTRELPGRTSPHLIAEVRPQVGGIVKERLFVEGSDVQARAAPLPDRSRPVRSGRGQCRGGAGPGENR